MPDLVGPAPRAQWTVSSPSLGAWSRVGTVLDAEPRSERWQIIIGTAQSEWEYSVHPVYSFCSCEQYLYNLRNCLFHQLYDLGDGSDSGGIMSILCCFLSLVLRSLWQAPRLPLRIAGPGPGVRKGGRRDCLRSGTCTTWVMVVTLVGSCTSCAASSVFTS